MMDATQDSQLHRNQLRRSILHDAASTAKENRVFIAAAEDRGVFAPGQHLAVRRACGFDRE